LTGGRGPLSQTNWSFVVSYSTDAGANWTRCNLSGSTSGFGYCLAVAPSQPSIVYAGGEVGGSGAVYRSTNSGLNWTRTSGSPSDTVFGLAVDPFDPNQIYAATGSGVYLTTNSGANWSLLYRQSGLRAVKIFPSAPDTVVAAGDSGVIISTNRGNSWARMNQGLGCLRITSLEFIRRAEIRLLAGTNGGAVYAWIFPTGIKELGANTPDWLRLSPNPARMKTIVKLGKPADLLALYDASGRRLWHQANTAAVVKIDVSRFPAGCYHLEAITDGQRSYCRLIISR